MVVGEGGAIMRVGIIGERPAGSFAMAMTHPCWSFFDRLLLARLCVAIELRRRLA
jgi:hypothetical protein